MKDEGPRIPFIIHPSSLERKGDTMALVTLYEIATGAPHRVHPIDVEDILMHGGYQQTQPSMTDPEESAAVPSMEDGASIAAPVMATRPRRQR